MRILVTGASGFIGSRIAHFLSNKNFKVICNYNKKPVKIKSVLKVKIKITKKISIDGPVDTIIHCASKTPVNSNNKKDTYIQNVNMMKNLIKLSKIKGVKTFIFLSSVSVYGLIKDQTLSESYKPYKPNSYGKSKTKCELMLGRYCRNSNTKYMVIRLPGVVGEGSHSNFITEISKKIQKNELINVTNKYNYFNNVVYVDDLSKFILKLLKKKNFKSNIVNLGSKNKIKIFELIDLIYNLLNVKNKRIKWNNNHSNSFTIDIKEAVKSGYKPSTVKKSLKNYLSKLSYKL